jgi:hypothetical protein
VLDTEILNDISLNRASVGIQGVKERRHAHILLLGGSVVAYGFYKQTNKLHGLSPRANCTD